MQLTKHERAVGKQVVVQLIHSTHFGSSHRWWVGYAGEEQPYLLTADDSPRARQAVLDKVAELTYWQAAQQGGAQVA